MMTIEKIYGVMGIFLVFVGTITTIWSILFMSEQQIEGTNKWGHFLTVFDSTVEQKTYGIIGVIFIFIGSVYQAIALFELNVSICISIALLVMPVIFLISIFLLKRNIVKWAIHKYNEKAYDRLEIKVPKGKKDVIRDFATAKGESLNGFVNRAIDETMTRESNEDTDA